MDVALISPIIDRKRRLLQHNIGLGYIASALIGNGHNVRMLDLEVMKEERPSDEYLEIAIKEFFRKDKYDVAGIGGFLPSFKHIRWVIDVVKEIDPDIQVWVGGSIASSIPDHVLKILRADVAVLHEGEVTACELAERMDAGGKPDFSDVRGIVFRRNGELIATPPRPLIQDIDNVPYPAWDLFDIERYISSPAWKGRRCLSLISTRGCPFNCYFCYHPYLGKKMRFHSPKRMVDEVECVASRYNVDYVHFSDDLTFSNPKRMFEFCDLYKERGLKIGWSGSCRANLMTEELCKRIAECNCEGVSVGIESFSDPILKNMKKGVSSEQNVRIIKLCRKYGIEPTLAFMIGNLGETRETAMETFKYIKKLKLKPMQFSLPTPFPQTELWEICVERGLIKDPISFYEKYDNIHTLLVNVSEMSDEELINLKEDLQKRWRILYSGPLKHQFKLIGSHIRFLLSLGIVGATKRIIEKLTREKVQFRGKKENLTKNTSF